MLESALVFDVEGCPIYWHLPVERTGSYIPDSRALWDVLWANRRLIGGVAHTHPWSGAIAPSAVDVTTFSAVENGLGKRLIWPIISLHEVGYFSWIGPKNHDYRAREDDFRIKEHLINRLRDLSRNGGQND